MWRMKTLGQKAGLTIRSEPVSAPTKCPTKVFFGQHELKQFFHELYSLWVSGLGK